MIARAVASLPPVARPTPGSAAIRLAVVVPGVAATLLLPGAPGTVALAAALAIAAVVIRPSATTVAALLAVEVLGWVYTLGVGGDVAAAWRSIGFAVALYLAHSAGALSAAVPLAARVDPAVPVGWFLRCLPGVVAAVVVGLFVAVLSSPHGSRVLDVVGLAAGTGVVAALVWLVRDGRRR